MVTVISVLSIKVLVFVVHFNKVGANTLTVTDHRKRRTGLSSRVVIQLVTV